MSVDDHIDRINRYGGPAFPVTHKMSSGGVYFSPGMKLRDWFAGQALRGLIEIKDALHVLNGEPEYPFERNLAESCYGIADAMLAAREAKP